MRTITIKRDGVHIEAPGCIINIRPGLRDMDGHRVTSVQVLADQSDEKWTLPDLDHAVSFNVRVREVLKNE